MRQNEGANEELLTVFVIFVFLHVRFGIERKRFQISCIRNSIEAGCEVVGKVLPDLTIVSIGAFTIDNGSFVPLTADCFLQDVLGEFSI